MKSLSENLTVRRLVVMCITLSLSAVCSDRLSAQDADPLDSAAEESLVEIIRLQHADAASVAETVIQLLSSDGSMTLQAVADPRVNSLILKAPGSALEEIHRLVEQLDRAAPASERQVKLFNLKNISPDNTLVGLLSLTAGDEADISIDARRNMVVAAGSRQALETIEAVLRELDVRPTPQPTAAATSAGELQIRLVWLVSGLDPGSRLEPPADLEHVTIELSNLGISDLQNASQMIVNTVPDASFTMSGSTELDQVYHIEITGLISDSGRANVFGEGKSFRNAPNAPTKRSGGDLVNQGVSLSKHPTLQLSIAAMGEEGASAGCQLETTIRAPLGQSVVLGVTPTGSLTSVFVVQVRPR